MPIEVQRYLWMYKYVVAVILAFGLFLALWSEDYHWINRFGALLVVLSLSLTLAQFVYESKLPEIIVQRRASLERALEERAIFSEERDKVVANSMRELSEGIESVRFKILLRSLVVAAIGELLHGFGDLMLHEALSFSELAPKLCRLLLVCGIG